MESMNDFIEEHAILQTDRISALEAELAAEKEKPRMISPRIIALEASNTQLREALEKYGRHYRVCVLDGAHDGYGDAGKCTCGFKQALEAKQWLPLSRRNRMSESLTVERIAEWRGWGKPDSHGGSNHWHRPDGCVIYEQELPRWLDPLSNDWVELLEALPDDIDIEFMFIDDVHRCQFWREEVEDYNPKVSIFGTGTTRRESFLAALAQLIDAQGD